MIESIETYLSKMISRGNKSESTALHQPVMSAWWKLKNATEPQGVNEEFTVSGRVYCSEWIADCKFCPNAMPISIKDPRFFCSHGRCSNGGNNGADGAAVRIVLPEPLMIMKIEALLVLRPQPMTRNWNPGETVVDLISENAAHGICLDKLEKAKAMLKGRWMQIFGSEDVDRMMKFSLRQLIGLEEIEEVEEAEECYEPSPECYDNCGDDDFDDGEK